MFDRIGFPSIYKATLNLKIIDPVDHVIKYVLTGWKQEDVVGLK
jgi:hypothetical protein